MSQDGNTFDGKLAQQDELPGCHDKLREAKVDMLSCSKKTSWEKAGHSCPLRQSATPPQMLTPHQMLTIWLWNAETFTFYTNTNHIHIQI